MASRFARAVPDVPAMRISVSCKELAYSTTLEKPFCVHNSGHHYPSLGRLLQQLDDFTGQCVPASPGLLEDGCAVARNFESSASRRNHLDLRIRPLFANLSRQPGSSGFVVSKRAVFDRDLHLATGFETLDVMLLRDGGHPVRASERLLVCNSGAVVERSAS